MNLHKKKIFRMSLYSADSKCFSRNRSVGTVWLCTYYWNVVYLESLRLCHSNFWIVWVVQKRLRMNKFVRTKSPTGSKFSKIFFEQLYTGWTVFVHLCCGFSLWRQMAPQQSAKFRTAFFGHFFPLWGRIYRRQLCMDLDAVFDVCTSVTEPECTLQRTKHYADPSVGGARRSAKLRSRFCKA